MASNSFSSNKSEFGLLIMGNTGSGKSNVGNIIIGYERFENDFRREKTATTITEYHRINTGSSDLIIYNLPALIQSNQEKIEKNKKEIIEVFKQCSTSVVIFVWTPVDGRPQPDDIIAFKALYQALKFSAKSLIFVINNLPKKRSSTFEGRFLALLKLMLHQIPITLEDIFFLDNFKWKDNDQFNIVRDRLLHCIAQHHENKQRLYGDIIVEYSELNMMRKIIHEQYIVIEANKQFFELEIKQTTDEYEAVKRNQDKSYHYMISQLQFQEQQESKDENKPGLKKQCKQFWEQVEFEKGIVKKVEKTYEIAKTKWEIKCKINEDDNDNSCSTRRAVAIGAAQGAASGGAIGAIAGGAVGGVGGAVAGIALVPCPLAVAGVAVAGTAVGATVGAVGGVAIGGIGGAIIALHKQRRKKHHQFDKCE